MDGDGLQHDDAVVHQHADAQGQSTQGHQVQADPAQIERREGADDAAGDGGGDDGGAAQIPQEQEEHRHGQQAAQLGGADQVVDGLLDEAGLIVQQGPTDAFGEAVQ